MVKRIAITAAKITVAGTSSKTIKGVGNVNTMTLSSLDNKPSHVGKGCIVMTTGDSQRKVIIGTGALIVP